MDIISIYNRIILHEQEQKEKFPAQDCNWKPARCEDYTLPPFQIPKNRSQKSQREQLSKVLAFVKHERNIRAAEGCTVMPIPTTNKHMLAIAGSPANASNLIKFMCKIGLISPESEKYRFGSRYEKNNYAKTYRYYYDNEQELLAYCEQEGIGEFSTKNCTRRKDAAIPDNLQIGIKDVAISSHLKLVKPKNLSRTEFENSRLMDSLYFPDTCTIYNVWVDDEAKYDRVSVYIYFSAETKGGYTRRATYRVMYSGSGEFVLDSTYDSRVGYGREISITQVVN